MAYALADFRALRQELRRRTKAIRGLPRDLCPESKVTPDLARNTSLGLHPVVIAVDECQVMFEHPQYGGEFEDTRMRFLGAPAGYEFISLVQAVLVAGGRETSLTEANRQRIAAVDQPIAMQVFTTPT